MRKTKSKGSRYSQSLGRVDPLDDQQVRVAQNSYTQMYRHSDLAFDYTTILAPVKTYLVQSTFAFMNVLPSTLARRKSFRISSGHTVRRRGSSKIVRIVMY
jgi:hypothetical protein